jgi:hypothetical protein
MPYADIEVRRKYHREYERRRRSNPELAEKQKAACKRWYEKRYRGDPVWRENKNRRRVLSKYNFSLEEFNRILHGQDGACAVCKEVKHIEEKGKRLHVDHCHATGKIRGLLCSSCNITLGHAKDNVTRLKSLIGYLEKNHATNAI